MKNNNSGFIVYVIIVVYINCLVLVWNFEGVV